MELIKSKRNVTMHVDNHFSYVRITDCFMYKEYVSIVVNIWHKTKKKKSENESNSFMIKPAESVTNLIKDQRIIFYK